MMLWRLMKPLRGRRSRLFNFTHGADLNAPDAGSEVRRGSWWFFFARTAGGYKFQKVLKTLGEIGVGLENSKVLGRNKCRGRVKCCHLSKGQSVSVEKIDI